MPVIRSFGTLQSFTSTGRPYSATSSTSVALYGLNQSYGRIYQQQPNVRICVDFLARNVAQLGLHVFKSVSDTDRQRLRDHQLAQWLSRPNPTTTRYRLIESTMQDLGIYLNAYWLKVRTGKRIGLVRLPPEQMRVEGELLPSYYVWTASNGQEREFSLSEIVHFGGYDPCNPVMGLSPMETLRRILAEEYASGQYRQNLWNNAARYEGVIVQDGSGPTYDPEKLRALRKQLQDEHAGPENSGKTGILPKGLKYDRASFSARESEYISSVKLRREICAAHYHIPLPLVGILEHATFSNVKEQHKHLYQDTLGPWLVNIEEEIERQLLPECEDTENVYTEFNIAEKLKGSFEEQAAALTSLVGRPVMTLNEGRSRLNLPKVTQDGADQVVLPLNTSDGRKQLPGAPDQDADDDA